MKRIYLLLVTILLLGTACAAPVADTEPVTREATETETAVTESVTEAPTAMDTPEQVAAYLRAHQKLPDYYLTKGEARELGWISEKGNLWDVAKGRVIGGDRFGNREGLLPDQKGRQWYEADVNYQGGFRGPERLVFSNDGLLFYTKDHYESFQDWTEE